MSNIPVPVKLPFGSWWLARNGDHVGKPVREGTFETAELAFVERFIQPGMTVLDLGAHHGLYTLLASKRVGAAGKVYAFEPSPRANAKTLRQHLILNLCRLLDSQRVWGGATKILRAICFCCRRLGGGMQQSEAPRGNGKNVSCPRRGRTARRLAGRTENRSRGF